MKVIIENVGKKIKEKILSSKDSLPLPIITV